MIEASHRLGALCHGLNWGEYKSLTNEYEFCVGKEGLSEPQGRGDGREMRTGQISDRVGERRWFSELHPAYSSNRTNHPINQPSLSLPSELPSLCQSFPSTVGLCTRAAPVMAAD